MSQEYVDAYYYNYVLYICLGCVTLFNPDSMVVEFANASYSSPYTFHVYKVILYLL